MVTVAAESRIFTVQCRISISLPVSANQLAEASDAPETVAAIACTMQASFSLEIDLLIDPAKSAAGKGRQRNPGGKLGKRDMGLRRDRFLKWLGTNHDGPKLH
jgi:hypothetical protein